MYKNTLDQTLQFLWTIYGGVLVGLLYDLFRAVRLMFHMGKIATAVIDVIFGLGALLIALVTLYIMNGGEIRLFAFLGFALGAAVYFTGPSFLLMKYVRKVSVYIDKRRKESEELKSAAKNNTEKE